jgi:hypothetical protein
MGVLVEVVVEVTVAVGVDVSAAPGIVQAEAPTKSNTNIKKNQRFMRRTVR